MNVEVRGPYLPLHAICGGEYFNLVTNSDEILCTVKRHPSETADETKSRADWLAALINNVEHA